MLTEDQLIVSTEMIGRRLGGSSISVLNKGHASAVSAARSNDTPPAWVHAIGIGVVCPSCAYYKHR